MKNTIIIALLLISFATLARSEEMTPELCSSLLNNERQLNSQLLTFISTTLSVIINRPVSQETPVQPTPPATPITFQPIGSVQREVFKQIIAVPVMKQMIQRDGVEQVNQQFCVYYLEDNLPKEVNITLSSGEWTNTGFANGNCQTTPRYEKKGALLHYISPSKAEVMLTFKVGDYEIKQLVDWL